MGDTEEKPPPLKKISISKPVYDRVAAHQKKRKRELGRHFTLSAVIEEAMTALDEKLKAETGK